MKLNKDTKYFLSQDAQVREENFGLLFYSMKGPQIYFLSSGKLLNASFFEGKQSLGQVLPMKRKNPSLKDQLMAALEQLVKKGVIVER